MAFPSRRQAALSLLALACAAAAPAFAQAWPDKPVRILVGASPGGGTDILARMLGEKFAADLKQSFVIENRPGASNTIAAEMTAKAAPDGTTLLLATNTAQAIAPHLLKLKFDPLKDLQPIGLVAVMPNVLVVSAASPYKSVKELLAAMNEKPGQLKYASSGIGSTQHIAGESLNLAAGTRAVHVPYKGSSAAHIDLISGQVQFMIDTTSSAMGQVKAGALRPLAVTTAKRLDELPNVPTVRELGMPALEIVTWYGLYATAGTPPEVVDKLHAELQRTLKLPDVQERLRGLGGQSEDLTIQQFTEFNRTEFDRFGKLVKAANMKAE